MATKRLLILVPVVLILALLQSAFWVPTYERQDVATPRRLETFIEGNIGDAKILNPTVSADGASSQINQLVFEGLLDLDAEQNWIGGLAERWETREEAFLAILPGRRLPDGQAATFEAVHARVREALAGADLADLAERVDAIDVLAAESREQTLTVTEEGEDGKPVQREVAVRIEVPERVRFRLSRVVPDLFERLTPALGAELLNPEGIEAQIHVENPADLEAIAPQIPGLLSVEEHNPIIVFHLRRGVKWHDGHPFDAGDVKFTYEAFLNPKNRSPRTSTWEPVKTVEIVDDFTVLVTYKRLYSPAITAWASGIVPEHLLDEEALEREMDRRGITGEARETFGFRESETVRHPIGTGPFRFVEWQGDEYIHLTRYDDYWDGPAEYRDFYYRVIPELVTQEVEFRSGAVDAYSAQPFQVARYRKDDRYQAVSTLTGSYSYIAYNLRKPLFQDVRVRRALGMAIDVDEVIEYVLYGEAERVSGPYYINTPYYDHDTPMLPYDPEGAKALLAEAGWTPGPDGILQKDGQRLAFQLLTNDGNPGRKAIITVAQNAWKRIGVDVAIQKLEWTVFLEEYVNSLEFDAIVLGWAGGGIDPDLYQIWHSSQTNPYQLNFVGYSDPVADDLIVRITKEYDPAEQNRLAHRLHRMIAEAQPYTFLYSQRATLMLDRKIAIVDRVDGQERYRKIRPVKSGAIKFYFDQWRKLPTVPVFEEEG